MDTKPAEPRLVEPPATEVRRVIKRYSNRKLYDTKDSRYVTLLQIAEMVRGGEEVQIIDNNTKEDLTEVTLAQIIYEEQKSASRTLPLQTLKELIHTRTEKVLSDLREGPIGRFIPGKGEKTEKSEKVEKTEPPPPPAPPSPPSKPPLVQRARESVTEWQHELDERIRSILPSILPWQQLEGEVKRLSARVEELEKKLKSAKGGKD